MSDAEYPLHRQVEHLSHEVTGLHERVSKVEETQNLMARTSVQVSSTLAGIEGMLHEVKGTIYGNDERAGLREDVRTFKRIGNFILFVVVPLASAALGAWLLWYLKA